jgi:hypothetical protein
VGERLPGVPSLVVDNRSGLVATIDHLIDDHGRRRIFFLGGPEHNSDARSRYEVYREALERHGIPYDPKLVAFGDFTMGLGASVTRAAVGRGATFDALVAANDGMALGAMQVLREHGVRIPEQVSVTGFDDLVLARFTDPPLTTIRQPIERMAALAIELLVRQIDGAVVPEVTELSVEVVRRRSCGCGPPGRSHAAIRSDATFEELVCLLDEQRSRLVERVETVLHLPVTHTGAGADSLVDGLRAELAGTRNAFNAAFETIMHEASDRVELHEELQAVVTLLRNTLPPGTDALEEIWHGARCLVSASHARSQAELRMTIERS